MQVLHEFPTDKRFHTDSGFIGACFLESQTAVYGSTGQWVRATPQQVQFSTGKILRPQLHPAPVQSHSGASKNTTTAPNSLNITGMSQTGDFLALAGVISADGSGSALVVYQLSSGRQMLLKTVEAIRQLECCMTKTGDGEQLLNLFVVFEGSQAFRLSCLVADFDNIDSSIDSFVLDFARASSGPFQLSFIRQAERLFVIRCDDETMLFIHDGAKLDAFKISEFDLDHRFSVQLNIKETVLQSVDIAYCSQKKVFFIVLADNKHGITLNTVEPNTAQMHRISNFSTQTKNSAQVWQVTKVRIDNSGDICTILLNSEGSESRLVSIDLNGAESEVLNDVKISGYATPIMDIFHQNFDNQAISLLCLFFHQAAVLPLRAAKESEPELPETIIKYYTEHGEEMKRNIEFQRGKHELIIDILLKKFGINPASFYPPTNEKQLRQLIKLIDDNADFDGTEKNCLRYYLVHPCISTMEENDFDSSSSDLTASMKNVIAGYYCIDFGSYSDAVKLLVSVASSSLVDFPDMILEILLNHGTRDDVSLFVQFFYGSCINALRPLMNVDFEAAFMYARRSRRVPEFVDLAVDCGLEFKLCSLPLSFDEEAIIVDKATSSTSSRIKWLLALYYFTHSRFGECRKLLQECKNLPDAQKLIDIIDTLNGAPAIDFPVVNNNQVTTDSCIWKPSKPFQKSNLSIVEQNEDVDMELVEYKNIDTPIKLSPKKHTTSIDNSPRPTVTDRRLSQYHLRRISSTGRNTSPFSQLNDSSHALRRKRQQQVIYASDVAEEVEQLAIQEEELRPLKEHAKRKHLLGESWPADQTNLLANDVRRSPRLRNKSPAAGELMDDAMSERSRSPSNRSKSPAKRDDVTTDDDADEFHDLSLNVEDPPSRSPRSKTRLNESAVAEQEDTDAESRYDMLSSSQSEEELQDDLDQNQGWFGKLSSWLTPHRTATEKRMRTITTESEHRQRLIESNDKRIRSMNVDGEQSRSRSVSPTKKMSPINRKKSPSPRRSPRKQHVDFAPESQDEEPAHRLTRRAGKQEPETDNINEQEEATSKSGSSRASSAPTSAVSTPAANDKASRQRALRKTASEVKQNITVRSTRPHITSSRPAVPRTPLVKKHDRKELTDEEDPRTPRQNESGIVSRRMLTRSMSKH